MIGYSQCWEDAEVVTRALKIEPKDVVVSVTSGGCNTLAIVSMEPQTVFSVDCKMEQNYLLELKLNAIKKLDYQETLGFIGYQGNNERKKKYLSLRNDLTQDARTYWDKNLKLIKRGVVNAGKFEKYLKAFRNLVLPLVHRKSTVKDLLESKSHDEQVQFYNQKWNTKGWRFIFRLFFSRFVMSRSGRNSEMFTHSQSTPAAQMFFYRTERAFKYGPLSDNFYLHYILLGKNCSLLPMYLNESTFNQLKICNNLHVVYSDLLSFLRSTPSGNISKFNLSDIFEPLSIDETREIFNEILRTATNGARIIFWNNLVIRDVPENLRHNFVADQQLIDDLKSIDRVFFYEKFYIYTVIK